jgi:GT2 family glycosyltransferase
MALRAQTLVPDQVVVADDGSTDDTALVLSQFPEVSVVRLSTSNGPAAARNAAVARAHTELIAFTDDDCVPAVDWLERIVRLADDGADVVLGQTTADPEAYAARGPWDHTMVTHGRDPMFSTCNIAYRTALFRELGGFDESFSGTAGGAQWGEDTDLGWRAQETGARIGYDGSCIVEHDVVRRGWTAYCLAGLRRTGIPRLVRKHPGFRSHLAAGHFVNEAHGWAPLLLVGVALGARVARVTPVAGSALAVAAGLPWLRFRLRGWPVYARRRDLPKVLPMLWAADLVETAVVVVAAGKNRVFVI